MVKDDQAAIVLVTSIAVLPGGEDGEEAVNTLLVYAPIVLAVILMLIVYGWL